MGCNVATSCPAGQKLDVAAGVCVVTGPTLPQARAEKSLGCNANNAKARKGNPCDASNGNKYQTESDYVGADGVPSVVRHYNSMLVSKDYGLGFGWTAIALKKLELYGTMLQVREGDGRGEPFTKNASGQWVGDADTKLTLTQDSTGYTLTRQDGGSERYDTSGRLVLETDRNNRSTSYTYNSSGKPITVTGPYGHVLTIGYDGNGRITSVTAPGGAVYAYSYDAQGNLSRVTYPDGSFLTYHYENPAFPHHLTGITDERGARFATYAYDSQGKAIRTEHAVTTNASPQERFGFTYNSATQTTVTDPVGTQEVMTFAVNLGVKNLTSKVNQGDGKVLTQAFDARNNLTCKKDEEGRVTTYTYSSTNQRLTQTEGQTGDCANPTATPETRTTTYQYLSPTLALPTVIASPSVHPGQEKEKRTEITYSNNLPTQITQKGYTPSGDSVLRTIRLQYNSHGQVTSIDGPRTDVDDVTTLDYYDCTSGGGCGSLKTVTNAIGHTTTFDAYDAHGRLLETTDPNGLKTAYAYDLRGRVLSVTQTPQGGSPRITQYSYDPRGNVTQTTQPDGLVLAYTYDQANYLTQVTDNLNNKVEYAYDPKGNRTQALTKDPDGSLVRSIQTAYDLRNRIAQINNAGSVTSQVFDAVGNLTNTQDPNGNPSAHQYDAMNRLLKTVDALSGNTLYSYDKNDRLAQVTAPNGANTTYEQDDLGNVLKEQSPDRGTVTYTHDAAGNAATITDARNITVGYTHDALNRVTGMDYPGTEEDVALTYDAYTGCTNGTGRLCKVQDQSGTTEYAYDGFGNVSQVTRTELGVSYITRYSYDNANRVASVTYPDGRVINFTRDAVGRITQASAVKDGATTALASNVTYNAAGLIKGLTYGNGLTENRTYDLRGDLTDQSLGSESRSYTYDLNGNLTQKTGNSLTHIYSYDVLDRLLQETSATAGQHGYGYDPNGNRLSFLENGEAKTYSYSPDTNRLTQVGHKEIVLDAAGNTVGDRNGKRRLEYGQAGRLLKVYKEKKWVATYLYNAQGQRTRKTTKHGTTVYHYDMQGHLLAETTDTGNPIRAYAWLNDLPLAQIDVKGRHDDKGKDHDRRRKPRKEHIAYLHADHLGTPRLATAADQNIVWRWEADAFGAKKPHDLDDDHEDDDDDHEITVNLRFAGQYFDSESGLFYNWNRYYDPKIGRYITSDPIGLKGGLNTYAYVDSNPLRFIDPTGLEIVCRYVIGGFYNKTVEEIVKPELGYWKPLCIPITKPQPEIPAPLPRWPGFPIDPNIQMDCSRRRWVVTQEEERRKKTERWMYHWEECTDTCTGKTFKNYLPDQLVN